MGLEEQELRAWVRRVAHGQASRRQFMRTMLGLGLSGPRLADLLATYAPAAAQDTRDVQQIFTPTRRGGGGKLRLLSWEAPTILNPHFAASRKDFEASRVVCEPLFSVNPDGDFIPILAAEIPSVENGSRAPDGTWTVWRLKPGVVWHDSAPFMADDVVFTWEYATDPATTATTVGLYEGILRIDKLNEHTVKVVFKEPTLRWYTGGDGLILPKHCFAEYRGVNARNAPYNLKPVGTGPYKIVDFTPGDVALYKINPHYHVSNRPFFDTVELKGGGDATSADLQSQAEALARRSQFIRQTFGRYVSEEVVAQLLDAPEGLELGGVKRKVTIVMSDVRGFTALAERLEPQEVMTFLNRYLEAMVDVLLAYRGTIIEMLGDGLLVLFGAPLSRDDDAERAVACALAMQLRLADINALHRRAGLPDVEMGIGMHTGEVVVGHIGSQQRTKYGVVGSAVNLTGRIESYTTGGQILISPTTYAETAALLTVSQQMTVTPKGVAAPITLYAVSAIRGTHALCLPTPTETLVSLPQALDVRYTILEGKFAGSAMYAGRVVKLAPKMAELHVAQPVAAFSNLKLHFLRPSGEVVPGELFAKVVEALPEETSRVVVRFTSIPEAARMFLDTVWG